MTRHFALRFAVTLPLEALANHCHQLNRALTLQRHHRLLRWRLVLILLVVGLGRRRLTLHLVMLLLGGALEHLTELDTQLVGQVLGELFSVVHRNVALHWKIVHGLPGSGLVHRSISRVDIAIYDRGHVAAFPVARKAFG